MAIVELIYAASLMKDGKIITLINLSFTTPSKAADLVSGQSENGWKFFKGLEEVRKTTTS